MSYDPTKPNVQVLSMSDDELERALLAWTEDMQIAALREGWDLFACSGSVSGPIQVQRIDDPDCVPDAKFEIPFLSSDGDAMRIVMTGTGPHHSLARLIVYTHNPEDYKRMEFAAGLIKE